MGDEGIKNNNRLCLCDCEQCALHTQLKPRILLALVNRGGTRRVAFGSL